MDQTTEQLLEKSAQFIETAQVKLAEYDALKASLVTQAVETAAVLVNRGVIAEEKKAEFVDAMVADPLKVYDVIRKMANIVSKANSLGDKAAESNPGELDAFERWALYGHPRATGVSTGNIL